MRLWLVALLVIFTTCVKAAQTFTVNGTRAVNPISLELPGWSLIDGGSTNMGPVVLPNVTASRILTLDSGHVVNPLTLSSGLTLSGTTLSIDILSLTTDGSPDGAADYVITYDASAAALKKVLLNSLPGGGGGGVSDTAFGSSWNGVTGVSPSKNAVYDQLHLFDVNDNGKVDVLDLSVAGLVRSTSGGVPSSAELSGDVTTSGSFAATIANNAVSYAKLQDVSATQRVLGRNTAGAGDPEEVTLSQLLDWVGSAAQGDIIYRGASSWTRLGAGTSGQYLQTLGAAANPQWATAVNAVAQGWGVQLSTTTGTLTANATNALTLMASNAITYQADFKGDTGSPLVQTADFMRTNVTIYVTNPIVGRVITFLLTGDNNAVDRTVTLATNGLPGNWPIIWGLSPNTNGATAFTVTNNMHTELSILTGSNQFSAFYTPKR